MAFGPRDLYAHGFCVELGAGLDGLSGVTQDQGLRTLGVVRISRRTQADWKKFLQMEYSFFVWLLSLSKISLRLIHVVVYIS